MRFVAFALCWSLVACAEFPALDGTLDTATQQSDYPALQSLGPLLGQSASMADATRQNGQSVLDRAARLRMRAATLRADVVDSETKLRMNQGINAAALQ